MTGLWDGFFNLFHTGKYLQVLLFLGGLLVLKVLWSLHRNKDIRIDFVDLLIGPDGKASGSKMMQLGAFAISTWAFVYLVIKNNLSEWYYTTYMIAWSGSHLISKWLADKAFQQNPPQPVYPKEDEVRIPPGYTEEDR